MLGATIAVSCGGASPSAPGVQSQPTTPASFAVFVFSRTEGFRHDSIAAGITAIQQQGRQLGFTVDAGEDAASFSDGNLARYRVVVFLSTTGDVLNGAQQVAFEGFIRQGGGFVGIHSAADTEYDWPFYGGLLGAYFAGHPDIQAGTIRLETPSHPSMSGLPATWIRRDEWYNFQRNPRGSLDVLATLDERTYTGGTMAPDHPIIWSHTYEGGRSWYTAGGHTTESFSEPLFVAHIGSAIVWAAGR
ncbi:MAG: ThuA domain-containing protein [Vicinamibacterales bacterium]|nr:ThuA domain-containing protein [Vicinamibacterales bacterium]